jgi:hypothetical protein
MLNHFTPAAPPRMRRWALPFVAVGLVIVVSACSSSTGDAVTGSGALRTESRDVGGFSAIELSGSGNVIIEQDGTESLSIEAEDNLLPDLTSDISGGTLRLGTREGVDLHPTLPVTYRVTVKDLAGLQLSGSGSVTAAGITTPAISIDISGSGDVTIDGTADSQAVDPLRLRRLRRGQPRQQELQRGDLRQRRRHRQRARHPRGRDQRQWKRHLHRQSAGQSEHQRLRGTAQGMRGRPLICLTRRRQRRPQPAPLDTPNGRRRTPLPRPLDRPDTDDARLQPIGAPR